MSEYPSAENQYGQGHRPPYGQSPYPGQPPYPGHPHDQAPGYPQYAPAPYAGAMPPQRGLPMMTVAPKNPGLSLLVSFFLPGVGSMMNGDVGKGIFILLGYLVSYVLMVVLISFITAPIFWIWGMIDGYQGAQSWNARHGIVS